MVGDEFEAKLSGLNKLAISFAASQISYDMY